jgi:hypothetical protein
VEQTPADVIAGRDPQLEKASWVKIACEAAEEWRKRGIDLHYIHRDNRSGLKAGALENGLKTAKGEFIAIFVADFVPNPDFLFERPGAQELVHLDIAALADAEGAVRGLVLDGRIPPAVEMKDMVGAGQVEAGPAGLQGKHEDARPCRVLEAFDHFIAPLLGHGAVQEQDLLPEDFLQVPPQQFAHLGELGEDQGPVADFEDLFEHLGQARQLAGTTLNGGVVAEELRRMVAHLLELGQGGEDQSFALDSRHRRLLAPGRARMRSRKRAGKTRLELLDAGAIRKGRTPELDARLPERREKGTARSSGVSPQRTSSSSPKAA